MTASKLEIYDLPSDIVPGPVPCAVLLPPGYEEGGEPLPLCLNLHGGGSSREALIASQQLFEGLWEAGTLEPMVIATPSTGVLSFYFDNPKGAQWETFVVGEFLAHLRDTYNVRGDREGTVMTGVSMGGHGTLKIGFARPNDFLAIAAVEAGIEPGFSRDQSPLRSRAYTVTSHSKGDAVYDSLLGPSADPDLYETNSPAVRLRDNVEAIKESGLSIYLECGDYDALNLQDGNEFLHRLLWDLDVSHEYHLVKDADHMGSTLVPSMIEAFSFISKALREATDPATPSELSKEGQAWLVWAKSGMKGPGPDFNMMSDEGALVLRKSFEDGVKELAKEDPTMARRFAVLPPTS